jgi:hypothetical protein
VPRKTSHSIMDTTPRAVADKAKDTWSELSSTFETAVGRTQSAAHDAQDSLRETRKSAKSSVRQARKNADKRVKEARSSVKSARNETGRRTNAARDALAGRQPRRRWPMLAGIFGIGIGAAIGALGARLTRRGTFDRLETKLSDTTEAGGFATGTPVIADVPPMIGKTMPAPAPMASAISVPQAVAPPHDGTAAANGLPKVTPTATTMPIPAARNLNGSES